MTISRPRWPLLGLLLCACGSSPAPNPLDDGAVPGSPDLARASDGGGEGDLPATIDLAGQPPGADLAAPPSGADPAADGPLKSARFDLTVPLGGGGFGSTLQTTIYGPSDDGTTLSKQGAPYPTVVFSPGFMLDRNAYAQYCRRLASHGFLVVTQSYRSAGDHEKDATDTQALLSWLLQPTGQDAPRVSGRADGNRIGLAGHSLGGKVSFFTAEKDNRVKATFGIDPVDGTKPPLSQPQPSAIAGLGKLNGASGLLGETISQGGFMPCAPAAENYEKFFQAAPAPSFAITFTGADHMDFLDDPNCLTCGFCGQGKRDPKETHALAMKYLTAFFRYHLLADAGALDTLTGARFKADAATGAVSLATK